MMVQSPQRMPSRALRFRLISVILNGSVEIVSKRGGRLKYGVVFLEGFGGHQRQSRRRRYCVKPLHNLHQADLRR